jgi:hypothetical protein
MRHRSFGWGALIGAAILAGCTASPAVDLPPPGTPVIRFGHDGAFNGGLVVSIFQGDVIVTEGSGPFGEKPFRRVDQGAEGLFERHRAYLAEAGPRAVRADRSDGLACVDYGSDFVEAVPPVAGFGAIGSGCPDNRAVLDLIAGLQKITATP